MKSRIDLFNTSFILHSDEDNAYIQSLLTYIRTKAEDIQKDVDVNDSLKHSILTLLLITHELKNLHNHSATDKEFALNSMKKIVSALAPDESNANILKSTHSTMNQLQDSNEHGTSWS